MTFRVDSIGQENPNDKKLKSPESDNFNNFYAQLKSGQPIIGNILNGSSTTDTAAANL